MLQSVEARSRMTEYHLNRRNIQDRTVQAMGKVPREDFVAGGYEEFAYEDSPLPGKQGARLKQPYLLALMLDAAEIGENDTVLEIGDSSGYTAAVASRIAAQVNCVVEDPAHVTGLAGRLSHLGFDNVELRTGANSLGWPQAGPYDAILWSVEEPTIPLKLQEQLDIGGRLILAGATDDGRRLIRIVRRSALVFEETDLGRIEERPAIGENASPSDRRIVEPLGEAEIVARESIPLPSLEDPGFGRVFDRFADKQFVLLGEASHGTSEFYRARAEITRRLIEEHGFSVVALEADWPDAALLDAHVRGHEPGSGTQVMPFERFPQWMWRNREFMDFIEWLRAYNQALEKSRRVAVRGLDIYSLHRSIAGVLDYLDRRDPQSAGIARERYGCLTPWQKNPEVYGRAVLTSRYRSCADEVAAQCKEMLASSLEQGATAEELFDARENARLIVSAERYYRIMYYGGAEAWNLRDRHMFETLQRVANAGNVRRKTVVWAHNSHIGDARFTEMGGARGELSLGQLCREAYGEDAALIGFGTHGGAVAAADEWNGETRIMPVRPALAGSYEDLFHETAQDSFLLDLAGNSKLRSVLEEQRLERLIGVIYRPASERMSHYVNASLSRQFDAYVWFEETGPVMPLAEGPEDTADAGTFPFGV